MLGQRRRALLASLLLVLPFVAVGVAARLAVPSLADALARALRDGVRAIEVHRPRAGARSGQVVAASNDVILDAGAPDAGAPAPSVDRPRLAAAPDATARSAPDAVASPAPVGPVRIRADAVQRAIDDDGRTIRARTTRGPDGRPAGARLTGVNGAGLGLRDGDVIIAVDGKLTLDDDAATDAALSAVARGDSVLHAKLTRDGQPFDVVLELPLAPSDAGNRPARP